MSEFLRTGSSARVEDFKSASLNNDPLLYPGERPATSFVTDGELVEKVLVRTDNDQQSFSVESDGQEVPIDQYLAMHGAEPLDERIPVIAYGANLSPGSLKSKFTKIGRPDALVVPTVYAILPGHDVVWSGGPGMLGNFIAILYAGDETKDTAVNVGVNFLTHEQLLVLHATELNYGLSQATVQIDGHDQLAYVYSGKDNVLIDDNHHPIAVEGIGATSRDLKAKSTEDMLKLILDEELLSEVAAARPDFPAGEVSPRQYVDFVKRLRKPKGSDATPRGDFKQLIHEMLATSGKVLQYTPNEQHFSWANPSTLASYGQMKRGILKNNIYRLPEMELDPDKWPDAEARRKVLGALSTHFHRHYPKN